MKKALIAILIGSALGLSACQPSTKTDDTTQEASAEVKSSGASFTSDEQKQAYAFGASVGQFIKTKVDVMESSGMVIDQSLIIEGFVDELNSQGKISADEMQTLIRAVETTVKEKQAEIAAKAGETNKTEGLAFLAENAKRDGVVVTDSGLQYEVLTSAEGPKPTAEDTVKVHYRGTLLDGTEFDSSYARQQPIEFPLGNVIKGWTEGVQLMSVGSKYKFYIPAELAYGARSTGKITPFSTLIFEVELLDIIKAESDN